jgi:hypothetical protein
VTEFFLPPPDPQPEQAPPRDPPPWTGRRHGRQVNEVVRDVMLATSELATVSIGYIDAYPCGFELEISGTTSVTFHALRREGEESGADIFGRHWPMVGEKCDVLPPQLLRIGLQLSDGRAASSIGGYDRPVDGPVMSSLSGGVSGRGGERDGDGETRFRQGYWISPLPPSGALTVLCEWPDLGIPLTRAEVDTRLILEAADRAQSLFPNGPSVFRDGREWRLGNESEVAFITAATTSGTAIGHTIPPIYAAYCTVQIPLRTEASELVEHERALMELLGAATEHQRWWLGYLDTGAHDVVFPFAPRTPFYGHGYVLVEAGPHQAATWREEGWNWALPDLMFPADRSWLLSTGWDDSWTCIGGTEQLIQSFLTHPMLGARTERVTPD